MIPDVEEWYILRTSQSPGQSIQAHHMIPMSVTKHDSADIVRIDIQVQHVLDHRIAPGPAIVEELVLTPRSFNDDQRGETVFGN